MKRHGKKWTHVIAVNDLYLDLLTAPSAATIVADNKLQAVSAGDGSASAYQRIRDKNVQIGTTPEPFTLQAWQLIDEINRAASGLSPSGYTTPIYVVTKQNLAFHGGAQNSFEPDNGYQAAYKKIWGK